jgi:hypothetical protein
VRNIQREIARFAGRVRRGQFLGAMIEGAFVWVLVVVGVLISARVIGVWIEPGPWLIPVLALPPPLWGWWRLHRSGFGRESSAQHLDRRLGLDGLLLTSLERDTDAWRQRLLDRLSQSDEVFPRLRGVRLLGRLVPAILAAAIVFLLPSPETHDIRADPLAAAAIEDFQKRLDSMLEEGVLREETREELQDRLDGVRDRLGREGEFSWSDLDTLEDSASHERDLRAAQLARLREALEAVAAKSLDEQNQAEAAAEMEELIQEAMEAGLLENLPAELLEKLGEGGDLSELASDCAGLGELAEALAQAARVELGELAEAGLLEGMTTSDLEALLGDLVEADLTGEPVGLGEDGDLAAILAAGRAASGRPGRGGLSRGRGDAYLNLSGDTKEATDAFEAKKLPPGRAPRAPGERVGFGRTAPRVAPVRDTGAGSAGDTGSGEAAWRRRLAPRLRDAVRRFFGKK